MKDLQTDYIMTEIYQYIKKYKNYSDPDWKEINKVKLKIQLSKSNEITLINSSWDEKEIKDIVLCK